MAIKKATTTADLTASAESAAPTVEQQVGAISELTDPAVVVEVKGPKYVTVKNPWDGAATQVPEEIVESLLASGYTKGK